MFLGVMVKNTIAFESTTTLDLGILNRGNYIIRVKKGMQRITQKVILLK